MFIPVETARDYKRWCLQWVRCPGHDHSVQRQAELLECEECCTNITLEHRWRGGHTSEGGLTTVLNGKAEEKWKSSEDRRRRWGSITNHCYTPMQALWWVNEAVSSRGNKQRLSPAKVSCMLLFMIFEILLSQFIISMKQISLLIKAKHKRKL